MKNEEGTGRWVQLEPCVRSEDEVENLYVRDYHRQMIDFAKPHLDDPISEREYGFVTVAASKERFQEWKRRIKRFLKESNEFLSETDDAPKEIYQLNVQFFRMSGSPKPKSS